MRKISPRFTAIPVTVTSLVATNTLSHFKAGLPSLKILLFLTVTELISTVVQNTAELIRVMSNH